MAVSVSTLLTGRCGRNCLYLNRLDNGPLAKRSFRKVVLADSCRGFNLATPSSLVSYRECVRNRACQEGRKSWLSLIGFRKFICACPRYMAMRVSLCPVPVAEPCLSVSLFCRLISLCFSKASPELHVDAPPEVPYFCFPVSFSTLLTGRCGRNCLYLN